MRANNCLPNFMEINLKKIIAAIGVAAILICIGGKTAHAAMPQNELLAQIGAVKKQILILQIQLIQIQIAGLQNQLAKIGKTAKFVSLLSPNGGEKIYNDRIFKICWEASGVEKISLALARSETSHIIAENIPAAPGCYDWEVDDVSGKNFKIKIFDAVDQKTQSSSAANFSIFARNDVCDDGTWRGFPFHYVLAALVDAEHEGVTDELRHARYAVASRLGLAAG